MPKILLVEDNEMNRDMLTRRLLRKGYEVILAEDGAEGVQKAIHESPALVILDMSLPVMTGWDAARSIKSHQNTKDTPVIALTAHALDSDKEKAISAGCDDFDTKPIDLPRLLKKMEDLLNRC